MKLVRQLKLTLRRGIADQVYEIDLCQVGPDLYVVNFRYGRRGTALKEGTKTSRATNLQAAEAAFEALAAEQRAKGFAEPGAATAPAPQPS